MHLISFETTRALIEQHHRELLQEAELRRIVRRLRRPSHEPAPTSSPATEPPGGLRVVPLSPVSRPPQQAPSAVAAIGDGGRCATRGGPDAA